MFQGFAPCKTRPSANTPFLMIMMMNIKMMIIDYDIIIMIIIILKMLAIMKAFYTLILLKTMMITLSSD